MLNIYILTIIFVLVVLTITMGFFDARPTKYPQVKDVIGRILELLKENKAVIPTDLNDKIRTSVLLHQKKAKLYRKKIQREKNKEVIRFLKGEMAKMLQELEKVYEELFRIVEIDIKKNNDLSELANLSENLKIYSDVLEQEYRKHHL